MSIALMTKSKTNPEVRELVPVAPQKTFTSRWLPACVILKLEWVPLFETGITVDPSNMDAVLGELGLLRQWMASRADDNYEVERISRLIDELRKARTQPDLDIFVG